VVLTCRGAIVNALMKYPTLEVLSKLSIVGHKTRSQLPIKIDKMDLRKLKSVPLPGVQGLTSLPGRIFTHLGDGSSERSC
jgi:hypothetical protein